MSDKICGFVVVLGENVSQEESDRIVIAIGQMRGVIEVAPQIASVQTMIAEARALTDIRQKVIDMLWPKPKE